MRCFEADDSTCSTAVGVCSITQCIHKALRSLYWDQIRPSRPDVAHRLSEQSPFLSMDQVDFYLRDSCTSTGVHVVQEGPGRVYYLLEVVPSWFKCWIDPMDKSYSFSEDVWDLWTHFMVCSARGLVPPIGDELYLGSAGGRYGLGRKLQKYVLLLYDGWEESPIRCDTCWAFLEAIQFYTLGTLCNFVQQAIQRGYLRYEHNTLLPVCESVEVSTALAARLLAQTSSENIPSGYVICVSDFERYLDAILNKCDPVPLSQLKKRIYAEFGEYVDPLKLGYTKLSDLVRSVSHLAVLDQDNIRRKVAVEDDDN